MGDPAIPTAADRAETQATAAKIVDGVIEDGPSDTGYPDDIRDIRMLYLDHRARVALDLFIFQLAQEIVLMKQELTGKTTSEP